jgi:hypothetical protein
MSVAAIQALLEGRDPETLIGPLFYLFTSLALHGGACSAHDALREHLLALALHPHVDPSLRLTAGALALEQRRDGT